jgi:hypothetical protein
MVKPSAVRALRMHGQVERAIATVHPCMVTPSQPVRVLRRDILACSSRRLSCSARNSSALTCASGNSASCSRRVKQRRKMQVRIYLFHLVLLLLTLLPEGDDTLIDFSLELVLDRTQLKSLRPQLRARLLERLWSERNRGVSRYQRIPFRRRCMARCSVPCSLAKSRSYMP